MSWARDTEYEVWHLLWGPSAGWDLVGEVDLRPHLEAVETAYRTARCWIYWDTERGYPRPIGLTQWTVMYRDWATRRGQELAARMTQLTEALRDAASSAQHTAEETALAFPAPAAVWQSPSTALRRARAQQALLEDLLAEPHHIDDERSQFTCQAATEPEEDVDTSRSVCGCGRDERVLRRLLLLAQATGVEHLTREAVAQP
ncbi:hypothetical protein ACIQMP_07750 [Streptomyces sp. NPDC091385]|uniref:hypothetical protein n=1 Tax=Streptomyces sp. NPDC091385 TaxID=3365997 RepID=UPI003803B9BB